MTHKTAVFAGLLLLFAASAMAQPIAREPEPSDVRLRFGPLWLNPTLSLTNLGIDTNVFNEADSEGPERDFTLTVTPQTDLWLRMGRTWLTGNIREDLVWYKEFASERSANSSYALAWLAPLTRISFSAGANWLSTRERPGFEIDARSERDERAVNGAVELRALSKTFFGVRAERRTIDFSSDAAFLGRNLRVELNRTQATGAVTVRHQLTPLTSLTLDVGRQQDRFDFSPLRDSDSTRVGFGVTFDPFALIKGSAQIGYRSFQPTVPGVPAYNGATANVNLSYVAFGFTRVGVQAVRDVEYSFEIGQPYYLRTGISGSIAQQIYGPMDVEARIGRQRLSYRDRADVAIRVANRADSVSTYGGGIGYRLGQDLRVGFNVDYYTRRSIVFDHRYEGLRFGTTVTYGL